MTLLSSGLEIMPTTLPEVMILVPRSFADERGSLAELFRADRYAEAGIARPFVQDNLSRSANGVVRGLHLQNPKLQGKLVTAIRGRILDVCVDVRVGSPSFGQHVSVELSHENRWQFWVPRGFAHGFSVLSEWADVLYKCDAYYDAASEITINHADPALGIDWHVATPILSPKDHAATALADTAGLPVYGS
jgi:dTDP-4-dehydrorhamnose 3,5-epimerase